MRVLTSIGVRGGGSDGGLIFSGLCEGVVGGAQDKEVCVVLCGPVGVRGSVGEKGGLSGV
eukprot:12368923-Prorocentrum_lima.AAC.1